jgi:hypothetical protein
MTRNLAKKEILNWTRIIYKPDKELIKEISLNPARYKKLFIDQIAESLYEDMRRARQLITSPFTINKEFSNLTKDEKSVWINYASEIPGKLKALNLFIHPFKDFCRTCIITDKEIEKLACLDHELYFRESSPAISKNSKSFRTGKKGDTAQVTFQNLPGARKWYFKELNYLIPPQLKKIGYEIIRPDEAAEIDMIMIRRLAKAIHSRYLQEMRSRD